MQLHVNKILFVAKHNWIKYFAQADHEKEQMLN